MSSETQRNDESTGAWPPVLPLRERMREVLPIVAFALVWRVASLLSFLTDPAWSRLRFDEAVVHGLGMRLAQGDLLLDAAPFVHSPLYTYFVGATYATFGVDSSNVLWIQALLGTAITAGVYGTARRLASRPAASAVALLYACTGPILFYEHFLLPDTLVAATITGAMLGWLRLLRSDRRRNGVGLGVWLGLAMLARPNAALLLPLLLIAPARGRARWGPRVAAVLMAMAVIAPATVRNATHGNDFVWVTASGPLHFYMGNSAESDGTFRAPTAWPGSTPGLLDQLDAADKALEERTGRDEAAPDVRRYWVREALADVGRAPGAWATVMLRKLGNLVRGREETDMRSYAFERRYVAGVRGALVPNGSLLIVGGLASLAFAWRRRHPAREPLVAMGLVLPVVTALIFFVVGRYRLAWYPVLAVALALGIDGAVGMWRTEGRRALARPAAGIAGLLLLVNLRIEPPDERPNHFLRGTELYDMFEPAMAAPHFMEAATHPRFRDAALQNAAIAMMESGMLDESEAALIALVEEREARGDREGTRRARRLLESLQEFHHGGTAP